MRLGGYGVPSFTEETMISKLKNWFLPDRAILYVKRYGWMIILLLIGLLIAGYVRKGSNSLLAGIGRAALKIAEKIQTIVEGLIYPKKEELKTKDEAEVFDMFKIVKGEDYERRSQ